MGAGGGHPRFLIAAVTALLAPLLALMATIGSGTVVGASSPSGYWLGADDGGVFAFGVPYFGNQTIPEICLEGCGIAGWPSGGGYWVLTTGPESQGSPGGPIVAGLSGSQTPTFAPLCLPDRCVDTPASTTRPWRITGVPGLKYGVLGLNADGAVYAVHGPNPSDYAQTYGSMAGRPFVGSMVGITSTPDGKGYWMVASDGGVFAFGDATFEGSMSGKQLNAPVVAIAATPDGKGYWLASADGGVFAFGDATFDGSVAGVPLNGPVVGLAADPSGSGYWLAASDGGVFAFGSAPFRGSLAGTRLNAPVTSIAASPS